jgi:hypothetical protein
MGKLITSEEALSTERKVELASLIQRMHECKILTKPYQDSISEEERCSREFHKKCEEAKKKLAVSPRVDQRNYKNSFISIDCLCFSK